MLTLGVSGGSPSYESVVPEACSWVSAFRMVLVENTLAEVPRRLVVARGALFRWNARFGAAFGALELRRACLQKRQTIGSRLAVSIVGLDALTVVGSFESCGRRKVEVEVEASNNLSTSLFLATLQGESKAPYYGVHESLQNQRK